MNSTMMKISIVTLAYYSNDKIIKSLSSILEQDYPNIEIIVADDGSEGFDKDSIVSYVKSHGDKFAVGINLNVYSNVHNVGTVENISRAYAFASGDIIINLSAGDVFLDKEIVSKIADKMQRDNLNFLVTRRLLYRGETNNIIRKIPDEYEIRQIKNNLKTAKDQYKALYTGFFYNMASGSVWAINKEWLNSLGGFDKRFILWEDGPFMAKITKLGYPLTYDYSIESIYYEDGGVSNSKISDKMKKDVSIFLRDGMNDDINFSIKERRLIEYRYSKMINDNKLLFKIKYIDCLIFEYIYRFKRKIFNL